MAKSKKKKSASRRYEVRASLDNFELAKAKSALRLQIYSRGDKVGELHVGRGSLYWWGANWQQAERISWSRFAAVMDQLAYGKD